MNASLIRITSCLLLGLLTAGPARAADTVETWDVGAVDLDFYLGLDGVGSRGPDRLYSSDVMVGYGLIERLSIYAGSSIEGNHDLSAGGASAYFGVYGTPLETDHVDLDLFLDLRASGAALGELQLGPSLELNLDAHPEMQTWGLYLRAGLPILRRGVTDGDGENESHEAALTLESTLGAYLHLTRGHQLLLELDGAWRPSPIDDEQRWELGGVALGYNVVINETIEVINQLFVDLPQASGDDVTVGVMTGFILTLSRS